MGAQVPTDPTLKGSGWAVAPRALTAVLGLGWPGAGVAQGCWVGRIHSGSEQQCPLLRGPGGDGWGWVKGDKEVPTSRDGDEM